MAEKRIGEITMTYENKGKTTLEIIRALSQAANVYDGYHSRGYEGEAEKLEGWAEYGKVGLKREKGHPLLDKRVMDGFGVKFHGNKLCINYHGEVNMKDIHRNGPKKYEQEIEQMFGDIVKFLKKEYKKITGKKITLTSQGDADSVIQRMNSIRNWVQSVKWYEIGGIKDVRDTDAGEKGEDWRGKATIKAALSSGKVDTLT